MAEGGDDNRDVQALRTSVTALERKVDLVAESLQQLIMNHSSGGRNTNRVNPRRNPRPHVGLNLGNRRNTPFHRSDSEEELQQRPNPPFDSDTDEEAKDKLEKSMVADNESMVACIVYKYKTAVRAVRHFAHYAQAASAAAATAREKGLIETVANVWDFHASAMLAAASSLQVSFIVS
ncbi:hypothetical protein EZV62_006293 [Acer yangbiense]|uniref:Uncharacterized protein n=1 Tax=Acer yangbiense TaxID=1000413 RepID=A0A5C7IQI9_9ROSI|nr:hypothetical protein EZV62_006293 [Acer yangbiense]